MSRLIGPRTFPDGSGDTDHRPPRKSPSDLRREARRLVQRQAEARNDRRDGWDGTGKDPYAVERQTGRLTKLDQEKRQLRRDVYRRAPELEGGAQ